MGELILVLALVALAAAWLTRLYWRAARQEGPSCGCGCSGGCGQDGACCPTVPQNTIDCLPRER